MFMLNLNCKILGDPRHVILLRGVKHDHVHVEY